jgi:hypothetical protein
MLHAKQALKRKRRSKAVAVLGAAGLLSLAGVSAQAAGPAADIPARHIDPSHQLMLSEEEVSDVSLATFYVFDKENAAAAPGVQLVRGGGGGCGHGCGGCGGFRGGGCGGFRGGGCGGFRGGGCGGFRGGGCGGFRGCGGCGGCGGCCLSWGACAFC